MNWQPRASWMTRAAASALLAASCSSGPGSSAPPTDSTTTTATTTAGPTSTTSTTNATTATTTAVRGLVVALRVEDRTGTEPGFDAAVRAILTDPRGWQRAGVTFAFDDEAAPSTVVLAEAAEVDALCRPYDTFGRYSCQLGPVVALNADRWRAATPEWPADLASYREMLVNHEVGHLLGQHHPDPQCPAPGQPAPVMAQQSTELPETGCLPNPWPLDHEIACVAATPASEHAPPYEPDPPPAC